MLASLGCSTTPAEVATTPNIDATVEARAKELVAAQPTPTTVMIVKEVRVLKEVIATDTPAPTTPRNTPIPTTTPTPYTIEVGGMLKVDTIWGLDGSPYLVNETVQIPTGVTLTIDAGVEVIASFTIFPDYKLFQVHGILRSQGTQPKLVSFKGLADEGIHFMSQREALATALLNICFSRIEEFAYFGGSDDRATTINVRDSALKNIGGRTQFSGNKVLFERNRFENAAGFDLGWLEGYFQHNCFVNKNSNSQVSDEVADTWFLIISQREMLFEINAFLDTGEVVFKAHDLAWDNVFSVGPHYYGTKAPTILDQMILDYCDDIDFGFKIELDDPLNTSPVEGCP